MTELLHKFIHQGRFHKMNYQIKFGELLRKTIEKSNYTIYALSKQSGLNRTLIQKVLVGERSLNEKQLKQLLPFLHLTPAETEQLEQVRLAEQIGTFTYFRCQYIKELAENIDSKKLEIPPVDITSKAPVSSYSYPVILNHQYQILNLIYDLAKETNYLYIYSSFDSAFVVEMLELFQKEEFSSLTITHLIPFIKGNTTNDSYTIKNVKVLSYILPFAFQNTTDYQANYYYEDFSTSATNVLFPYYLVSDKYVLLFSKDYQNALLLGDKPHDFYQSSFEKLNQSAFSLFQCVDSPMSVLERYIVLKQTNYAYALDRQPCIMHYIDESMPDALIHDYLDFKAPIVEMILKRHYQLQEITDTITAFNWQGLVAFCKEGIIYDYPPEFYRPFTPDERLLILNRILESNKQGKKYFLLVNEEKFRPCPEFTFFSSGADALFTLFVNGGYKVCTIHETTITLALQEFMENAISLQYVHDVNTSNEYIKEAIRLVCKNK